MRHTPGSKARVPVPNSYRANQGMRSPLRGAQTDARGPVQIVRNSMSGRTSHAVKASRSSRWSMMSA
jgi:hypothetical protein